MYDLPFCPSVAYSVPAPLGLPTPALLASYNQTVQTSLSVFLRTLTTFPCHNLTFGAYSRVANCESCAASYQTWLCAVVMPRCTDAPRNATLDSLNANTNTREWNVPSNYHPTLLRDTPSISRTPGFAPDSLASTFDNFTTRAISTSLTTPFPYAEVPPCLDVCHLVQARCPPFLQWTCPSLKEGGGTGTAGYGVMRNVDGGARMAGDPGGGLKGRGGDRFGNVL